MEHEMRSLLIRTKTISCSSRLILAGWLAGWLAGGQASASLLIIRPRLLSVLGVVYKFVERGDARGSRVHNETESVAGQCP